MKKIKYIILTLIILSLPTFAAPNYTYTMGTQNNNYNNYTGYYVNEEITTPITKIGGLENLSTEEFNEEEKGLEILWNQWHADVRNIIVRKSALAENTLIYLYYKVNNNQNIYDIVVISIKESDLSKSPIAIIANRSFYAYSQSANKYYILSSPNNISIGIGDMTKSLPNANCKEVGKYMIPNYQVLEKLVNSVKDLNKNNVLIFPQKSKRTSVQVSQGITTIDWLKMGRDLTATDFNDIEKQ